MTVPDYARHAHIGFTDSSLETRCSLGSTSPKGPFTYRIYTAPQPWRPIREQPEYWTEVRADAAAFRSAHLFPRACACARLHMHAPRA